MANYRTRIMRFAGSVLTATMLIFGLGAPLATALETDVVDGGPPMYSVDFDVWGAATGSTYEVTYQGTTYPITVIPGVDKTFTVESGTIVNFSFSSYLYVTDSWRSRLDGSPGSPATITNDTTFSATYNPDEYKVTFDQTGLPLGTDYYFSFGLLAGPGLIPMVAGTPYSAWILSGEGLTFSYQDPVFTLLGAYSLGSFTTVGSVGDTGGAIGAEFLTINGPMMIYGNYTSGNITGIVFYDYNNNGIRDPGEPGIPNATVQLFGVPQEQEQQPDSLMGVASIPGGYSSMLSTFSDGNGNYIFANLPAGTFYIRALLPNGGQQDSGAIVLAVTDGNMNSGQADFAQPYTLPYTGR